MRDREHIREIDRVLNGEETGRDALVADSWRRCVERYGMDPTRQDPAHIVSEGLFREHREQSERLISIARSGLQSLFRQVAGQNYVLLLADAKGVCVDFFGDTRFEDELREAGLYLGADWSEDLAGTCGVGSCLVTGDAVTIHQGDHFGLLHTPLSCTSAPIFDTCGQLAAVLDVSLLRSPSPKSSQNLAMSLVTASARRVEMANLMAMSRREWVLRFSTSPEFLEVDPEAAVALDGSGRIIGMTHGARHLAPEGSGSIIGRQIDELIECSMDDLPDLMRGQPTEERVLRLKDGRGLFGHAIAPQTISIKQRPSRARLGALSSFAGPDPAMDTLLRQAARLAATKIPLLIVGESGSGKEQFARAIHTSGREARSFHTLRCAGLPLADLARLRDAAPGTVFLRGIEDLQPEAQDLLLSVLDARDDFRFLVSARNDVGVEQCGLREDLMFRLIGAKLELPPLRLRGDFNWLLDRLLKRRAPDGCNLTPAARIELNGRDWPGNIRELGQALDVALATTDGQVIDVGDLPPPTQSTIEQKTPDMDLEALLVACGWNMAQAARRLGVNRSTVMRRVRKAGIRVPD